MIYVCCLGYNNARAIEGAFDRFIQLTDTCDLPIRKIFFSAHYPLGTREKLIDLCSQYVWRFIELDSNRGQDGNTVAIAEYLARQCHLANDDVVIMWDADNAPRDRDWLKKCLHVFESERRAAYVIPRRDPAWVHDNQDAHPPIAGQPVRRLTWPGGFSMGLFSGRFFLQLPTAIQPTHQYYGGTEASFMRAWTSVGLEGYMLSDSWDDMTNVDFDPAYVAWKQAVIQKYGEQTSFSDWLKENGHLNFEGVVRSESL